MDSRIVPSNVEVHGASIQALVDSMERLKVKTKKILTLHGINQIDVTNWYPLSDVVACYRDILTEVGPSTMRTIGRNIPKHVRFPPDISSFELALQALDRMAKMHHRGSGYVGGYQYATSEARTGRLVCSNFYPCEFTQGTIDALYDRFRPKDSFVLHLDHDASGCRHTGALSRALITSSGEH